VSFRPGHPSLLSSYTAMASAESERVGVGLRDPANPPPIAAGLAGSRMSHGALSLFTEDRWAEVGVVQQDQDAEMAALLGFSGGFGKRR
jgi:hypothetical protein